MSGEHGCPNCRCGGNAFPNRTTNNAMTLWSTPSFDGASSMMPAPPTPSSLAGWFDQQVSRLQEDLFRHRFFEMPQLAREAAGVAFDPARRSRLFDALFSGTADDISSGAAPTFVTNPTTQQVECQLNTGCGDFFRPEDVEVNVNGRAVEFKARREQISPDGHSYAVREVRRVVTVPETADVERLSAEMAPTGKMLITVPLLQPAIQQAPPGGPVPVKINRLPAVTAAPAAPQPPTE